MVDWASGGIGLAVGAILGAVAERAVGRPVDRLFGWAQDRRSRARARTAIEQLQEHGEFLVAGAQERVFVHQFSPSGFDLVTRVVRPGPVEAQLERLHPDLRPVEPGEVAELVEAQRVRLERDPSAWNEQKFGVWAVSLEHDAIADRPRLTIDFHRSDYATFSALRTAWRSAQGQVALDALTAERLREVLPGLSHSFGVNATVVTADGRLLLTRRNSTISSERGLRHVSMNEGMHVNDVTDREPDPMVTIRRGIAEELGIPSADIPDECVTMHALILDAERYQWAFLAHVDLSRKKGSPWTAERLRMVRQAGVATDAWESGS